MVRVKSPEHDMVWEGKNALEVLCKMKASVFSRGRSMSMQLFAENLTADFKSIADLEIHPVGDTDEKLADSLLAELLRVGNLVLHDGVARTSSGETIN